MLDSHSGSNRLCTHPRKGSLGMAAHHGNGASSEWEPRPDLSQQLTQRSLSLITSNNLQPGDRLPTMKELATRYSVATPTLREAVRRLQATGVVDIRHGSGIYVRKITQGVVITNPHVGEIDATTVFDLLDARLAIEPFLAGRAALNASPHDLDVLQAMLDEAERSLNGHDSQLHRANMRFHAEVGRVSGNTILADFMESLVELYAREQLGILEVFNARVEDHHDHVAIFAAIRDHNAAEAESRMATHLKGVRTVVQQRLTTLATLVIARLTNRRTRMYCERAAYSGQRDRPRQPPTIGIAHGNSGTVLQRPRRRLSPRLPRLARGGCEPGSGAHPAHHGSGER